MKLQNFIATLVATVAIVFGSAVFTSADTETETPVNELVNVAEDIVVDDAEVYNVNVSESGDVTLTEVNELVTEAPTPVETPVVPTPVVEKPQVEEPVDDVETHLPPAPITETPVNELVVPTPEEEEVPPTPEVELPKVEEPVDPAPTPEEPKTPQPETPVVSETPAPKVEQPKLEVETPTPAPTTPTPVAPVVNVTSRRRLPMTGTSSSVSILLALLGVALLAAMSATPKIKEMI